VSTKYVAADTAIAIDGNFDGHEDLLKLLIEMGLFANQ
jgi:hypothetical protein